MAEVGYFGWGWLVATAIAAGWALRSPAPALRFLAVWWLIALTLVTIWIPFAWMRYLTPLLVPSGLLGAWAMCGLIVLFWRSTAKALNGST